SSAARLHALRRSNGSSRAGRRMTTTRPSPGFSPRWNELPRATGCSAPADTLAAMARIYERITAALLWIAAFCFASGVFFCITLLFRSLPPTPPVAIGVVTIERYSKLKDYLGAAIFFLAVPPLFYLTTGKAGWILLLPVAIAFGATRALLFFDTRSWLRQLFRRELNPYH